MQIRMKNRGRISIDGRDFVGGSVVINGKKVMVDGVEQDGELVGPVSVTVHGDAQSIDGVFAEITVSGACGSAKSMSGSIQCGDVTGSVSTMSGSVKAGKVGGNISTMSGSVRHS